ncbi:hypothetical protein CCB80_13050 [Armatimonadetes bacterium Uphvl-Ar1]|nr:hypothetical protein CCB80_13050 [Armatimonadetes bacterium Uphvl-Ar1]
MGGSKRDGGRKGVVVIRWVAVVLTCLALIYWGYRFTYYSPKEHLLLELVGMSTREVEKSLGTPKRILTSQEFHKRIRSKNLDWYPKPRSNYSGDVVWYYELAPNKFTFILIQDNIVTDLYVGST